MDLPGVGADEGEVPQSADEWPGRWYRLTVDYGEGPGMIPAGTHMLVRSIHIPGTPGIGADTEASPLCVMVHKAPSGRWVPRHVHFTGRAFRQLFVPADEPPQWQEWVEQQSGE